MASTSARNSNDRAEEIFVDTRFFWKRWQILVIAND